MKEKRTNSSAPQASTSSAQPEGPVEKALSQTEQIEAIAELNSQCYGLTRQVERNNVALKKELGTHHSATIAKMRAESLKRIIELKNDYAEKIKLIKQLLVQIDKPVKDEIVKQVQEQIKKAIDVDFKEVIKVYFTIQEEAQKRQVLYAKNLYRLAHPEASAEEVELIKTADIEGLLLSVVLKDSINNAATEALIYAKARLAEALKIENSLAELAVLFQTAAILVSTQAEEIVQIQGNVLSAKESTRDGREEVTRAKSI